MRKLAHESGVDLSAVTGTGVGGRIRKQDVLAATSASVSTAAPVAAPAKALEVSPLRGTTVAMSRLRKVIAERAVISMQSSAQLTSVVEVPKAGHAPVLSHPDAVRREVEDFLSFGLPAAVPAPGRPVDVARGSMLTPVTTALH